MIINRIYETQNLLSLWLVSFLVGLRTYQHPCNEGSVFSFTFLPGILFMIWNLKPNVSRMFRCNIFTSTNGILLRNPQFILSWTNSDVNWPIRQHEYETGRTAECQRPSPRPTFSSACPVPIAAATFHAALSFTCSQ